MSALLDLEPPQERLVSILARIVFADRGSRTDTIVEVKSP